MLMVLFVAEDGGDLDDVVVVMVKLCVMKWL
jgi:hypothetical protein